MVLLIDIGNTTVAIRGIDVTGNYTETYKMPTGISEDYISLLGDLNLMSEVESCIISSVVPLVSECVFEAFKKVFGIEPRVLKRADIKMPVLVDEPEKVGMDRLVEAYYVYRNYKLPAVTVDMGTATTIGVVTKDGFVGGSISSGIETSLNAIGSKGAQLFKVDPYVPKSVIGKNTAECLNIGAVYGAASMVDGMIKQISKELGTDVSVVITGGNSGLIRDILNTDVVYDENLIFNGLKEIILADL